MDCEQHPTTKLKLVGGSIINIIGDDVTVKTSLGEYFGRVLLYNGEDKITLEAYGGEDEDGGDIRQVIQILAPEMVITTIN